MRAAIETAHAWEISEAVRGGEISAVEVTKHYLDRIDATNPQLNAYTLVTRERALAESHAVDLLVATKREIGRAHV